MDTAAQTVECSTDRQEGAVRGEAALLLRLEGAGVFAASLAAYAALGGSWWWYAGLFLVPDLSMFGYLRGPAFGARLYNLGHSCLLPFAMAMAGYAASRTPLIAVAAIWFGHIGFDRALGYGLKYPSAFFHTHLLWRD